MTVLCTLVPRAPHLTVGFVVCAVDNMHDYTLVGTLYDFDDTFVDDTFVNLRDFFLFWKNKFFS